MLRTALKILCVGAFVACATPAMAGGFAFFTGTWVNSDPATKNMPKIVITQSGATLKVQGFGKCTPSLCNWGTVTADTYATTVVDNLQTKATTLIAIFPLSVKETLVIMEDGANIKVYEYAKFPGGFGQTDFVTVETFHK